MWKGMCFITNSNSLNNLIPYIIFYQPTLFCPKSATTLTKSFLLSSLNRTRVILLRSITKKAKMPAMPWGPLSDPVSIIVPIVLLTDTATPARAIVKVVIGATTTALIEGGVLIEAKGSIDEAVMIIENTMTGWIAGAADPHIGGAVVHLDSVDLHLRRIGLEEEDIEISGEEAVEVEETGMINFYLYLLQELLTNFQRRSWG